MIISEVAFHKENLTDVKIQLQRQHLRDPRAKNPLENVTPTRRLCDRIRQYV